VALLEGAEQARLLRPLELSDLVQEEGTPRGALETPSAPADGAGEGAPFVPEELSLEQRRGEGGTVHMDEDPLAPREAVKQPRAHALPDPGLPGDQHRRVQGCQAPQLGPDLPHCPGLAGQLFAARPRLMHRRSPPC
jgi:hypothetical protein